MIRILYKQGIPSVLNLMLCLLFCWIPGSLLAQGLDYYFELPENSGMYNVKTDFGAVGDGIKDDTQAFIEAFRGDSLSYFTGEKEGGYRAIYIPPGTYLIKKPLVIGDKKKVILGAGRDSVIIRLAPFSEGFGDAENPLMFIDALAQQHPAQNFWMFIKHLTIQIGEGNPGAIALSFHTNNAGGVYDVNILSDDPQRAGYCGLQLKSWPGPGIIKHVMVDGFDFGVLVNDDQYSMTFEYLSLRNSRIAAFKNTANTCSIRKLKIDNTPIGVINSGNQSMMTLIDSEINGSGDVAVECKNQGLMLVRDLKTQGFAVAVISEGDTALGPDVSEWHSHPQGAVYPSRALTIKLPIEETPEIPYENDPLKYAVVNGSTGDFATAVQDAIDAGAEAIYIAPSWGKPELSSSYPFSKTIIVRNNVKRIMGMGNAILTPSISNGPVFRIEDGNTDTVIIQNIFMNYGVSYTYTYEQASLRTLVIQNCSGSYHNVIDRCKVFIEDIVGNPVECANMKAWIRDLNTETYDYTHVVNDNSDIWTLGHKTEKDQTIYETRNGGRTELLGGLFYKNNEHTPHPLLVMNEGEGSFSYRAKGLQYLFHLEETRDGETRNYPASFTYGSRMALLSAGQGMVPDEPAGLTAEGISSSAILLNWTDASDNEEGYTIQRSSNNTVFSDVGLVEANETSFEDKGLEASTSYFYRVLAYSSDGNSLNLFTPVVEGSTQTLGISRKDMLPAITVYPSPARDELYLKVSEAGFESGSLKIYSVLGKLIESYQVKISEGTQRLELGHLESGIYLIELSNKMINMNWKICIQN